MILNCLERIGPRMTAAILKTLHPFKYPSLKAAKYEIQKPSTCRATLFHCKFWSMFPVFHLHGVINLTHNKNTCCGLKKCGALIG